MSQPEPSAPSVRLTTWGLTIANVLTVRFNRTLRVPEEGEWPLPAGLGNFPAVSGVSLGAAAPAAWGTADVVVLPMYLQEAMWLGFSAAEPLALQVCVGGRCAVTGEAQRDELSAQPQNYLPLPEQPWLDGVNSGNGVVSQFVAVPKGSGASVEAQLTGTEKRGGLQLTVWGLTPSARAAWQQEQEEQRRRMAQWADLNGGYDAARPMAAAPEMGIGAGGTIRQTIFVDKRPLADYEDVPLARADVQLVDAAAWPELTGQQPPPTPVTIDAYTRAGIPWFDYYAPGRKALPGAEMLRRLRKSGTWLQG